MAKNTRKTQAADQLNMAVAAESDLIESAMSDDAILAGMLDEIVEDATPALVPVEPDPILAHESEIEAAVGELEKEEAIQTIYAEQDAATPTVCEGDAPTTDAEAAETTTAKKKRSTTPKEPKEPRVTYVTHSKAEVLQAKLGEKAGEYLILEAADVTLDADELKAKMDEVLAAIDACGQKKVQEKAVMLFGWMMKGGKLNEVMERTFRLLAKEGELTSGDKGNLHAELLAKPYSVGTARAQAGQMFALLPLLKIATKEKGRMTLNPNSMIFMKAKAELGLA